MAASRRPSFLKRQKEQARVARAAEKRDARRARKHVKTQAAEMQDADPIESDMPESPDDSSETPEETTH